MLPGNQLIQHYAKFTSHRERQTQGLSLQVEKRFFKTLGIQGTKWERLGPSQTLGHHFLAGHCYQDSQSLAHTLAAQACGLQPPSEVWVVEGVGCVSTRVRKWHLLHSIVPGVPLDEALLV